MAITLWAIWKSFASPCTVRQLLIDHLNDEIAASHTIKNPTKREARIKTIHQRWRTKLYWTANNNLPYGYILPRRHFFQPALYQHQSLLFIVPYDQFFLILHAFELHNCIQISVE